jgi:hypothetical protein
MNKSAYQLVNRGRNGAPRWVVELNGVHQYSSRTKGIAMSFLRFARRQEREQKPTA